MSTLGFRARVLDEAGGMLRMMETLQGTVRGEILSKETIFRIQNLSSERRFLLLSQVSNRASARRRIRGDRRAAMVLAQFQGQHSTSY